MSHPSTKLAPKQYSPFKIIRVISCTSFQLQLPHLWKIHPTFHATLLTPYKETREHGINFTEPPPDLIDRQQEWEVEKVLGSRQRHNQLQYLIRWKGLSKAHDSWEPLTHISTNQLIEDFHQKNPTAVRTAHIKTPHLNSQPTSLCHVIMSTNPTPPSLSLWVPEDTP